MAEDRMFKNLYVKNILVAVAMAVFGFVILNLTFLFDFLFQSLIDGIIRLFVSIDVNMAWSWFPPLKHTLFVIVVLSISQFAFKSKLGDIYKATLSTVPSAVILATVGMFLYQWPILVYIMSALFLGIIFCYLYRTKKPWLYYYAIILVASALLIMTLSGTEI